MEIIPQLISRYSVVLYAVCAIACAYFLFTGVASLRELRRVQFKLEHNAVVSRAISALLKAVACVAIAGGIFLVAALAPARPTEALLGAVTTTPNRIVIPTSMPTAVITSGQALVSDSFTPTVVFLDAAGTPTTTISVPGQAATPVLRLVAKPLDQELQPACQNPNAQISNPTAQEKVTGAYIVRGTALLEAGESYALEILVPGAAQWSFVGSGNTTISGGVLFENFNAGNFAPGVYPFRLVLLGQDGNERATCRMPMTIGP
jgi:hypothetical protein